MSKFSNLQLFETLNFKERKRKSVVVVYLWYLTPKTRFLFQVVPYKATSQLLKVRFCASFIPSWFTATRVHHTISPRSPSTGNLLHPSPDLEIWALDTACWRQRDRICGWGGARNNRPIRWAEAGRLQETLLSEAPPLGVQGFVLVIHGEESHCWYAGHCWQGMPVAGWCGRDISNERYMYLILP